MYIILLITFTMQLNLRQQTMYILLTCYSHLRVAIEKKYPKTKQFKKLEQSCTKIKNIRRTLRKYSKEFITYNFKTILNIHKQNANIHEDGGFLQIQWSVWTNSPGAVGREPPPLVKAFTVTDMWARGNHLGPSPG